MYTLQLLHASDLEAGLAATGRMGNFAAIVDRLEDQYANTIRIISGDAWIPGPFYAAESDPSIKAALDAFYGISLPAGPQTSGRVSVAFMNAIGVDVASFGNHEWDLGPNAVAGALFPSGAYPGARFPYLSANLSFAAEPALSGRIAADNQEASTIRGRLAGTSVVTINGETIGVVGATTQVLESISSPGNVSVVGPKANDMDALAAILQPKIDALTALGINKIILSSHLQQYRLESTLAGKLSGVDIIVSGGSNALFADSQDPLRAGDAAVATYPLLLTDRDGNPTLQVNTDGEYSYVGRLVVQFDDQGHVVPASIDANVSGAFRTDDAGVAAVYGSDLAQAFAPGSKGARVDALADAVAAVIQAKDGTLFGFTDVFLDGKRNDVRRQETNLGDLSADANLWYARQADPTVTVSIKNGGGIRDSIGTFGVGADAPELPPAANPAAGKPEGAVSQLDIENSLRFNNTLSLVTVSAEELLAVLEHAVRASTATATPGQFAQIGGINFSWDIARPAGDRVISATIVDDQGAILDVLARNGDLVGDANREIRVVTLNFLASGGDGYPFPAFGANRVDLIQPGARTGTATFADDGSEQDALAEFLKAVHPTRATAYAQAETPPSHDGRNQQLGLRTDTVEPVLGFDLWRESTGNGASLTEWRGLATNLDYANARIAGEQRSAAFNDSTGAKIARFFAGDGDAAIREVDFAGAASVGGNGAMTLDWQGRNAVLGLDTAWDSIRNIRLNEFTGDALQVKNFAMVAFNFTNADPRPDLDYDLVLQGVKRVNGRTGDGDDHVVVEVDSDGGPIQANQIVITTGGGNDRVEIRASTIDYAPGAYDPAWTRSVVSLGDGDDSFLGGEGTDIVTGGRGNDLLDGRGGYDIAIFQGTRASYAVQVTDAATGRTIVTGADGTDELVHIEQMRFDDGVLKLIGGIWI